MAGHRASASIYATVGIAAATLVVMGGILAGPAILGCAGEPEGMAACLRDRASDTGLLAPGDAPPSEIEIGELPAEPEMPSPPPPGWMEATANEYQPSRLVPVDLSASLAGVTAAEAEPISEPPASVAMMPVPVLDAAGRESGAPAIPVALGASENALRATGATVLGSAPSAAVRPDPGTVVVEQISPASEVAEPIHVTSLSGAGEWVRANPVEPAKAEVEPLPLANALDVTSSVPAVPDPATVELQDDIDAVAPAPTPQPEVAPPPSQPPMAFNPQYPNVLVLPPPVSGDNSSFRSLQLD